MNRDKSGRFAPVNPQWYDSDIKIAYLDIEGSDLVADEGYVLSYCIKQRDVNKIISNSYCNQSQVYHHHHH